jgi:diacylglycerol O-acyltransferase / wax synthase
MEHLSPLDSLFLHVEDGATHLHIGSCAVFAGPSPAFDDFRRLVSQKLPLLPRYRQKVRFVPGDLGAPVWVDDRSFELGYHVRHTALPPPGGDDERDALMGRLMSQALDRHRPLWEAWMVEGLPNGQWAVISKVHHCMVDGISGTDLMTLLLDSGPDPAAPPADTWTPRREPSGAALVVLARRPAAALLAVGRAARAPRRALATTGATIGGLFALGRELRPARSLSIEGGIGPHRRWAAAQATLDDVKVIRGRFGGTVNDVVVSAIAGAFRDLLLARGDGVEGVVFRSLVPVSVRAPGDHSTNNQVTAMVAELPIGIADPVARLATVHRHLIELRAAHQPQAGQALIAAAAFAPPVLYALGLRAASAAARRAPQRSVHTVTTNVPGPQQPLYALGREMVEYLPFVPVAQGIRFAVAILSYHGRLAFGVTGDFDTASDVGWFCRRIEDHVAVLRDLAGETDAAGDRDAGRAVAAGREH